MNNIKVIGLGALNLDHLYQVEQILEDGEAVVNKAASFAGGSAANTIYGLAKLGVASGFTGAVGDDDEGKRLVEGFETVGVDTSQIRVKAGGKTGSVLCLSDNLGRRSLYVMPGANSLLVMDDFNLNYINEAGMLHLTSFAGERQFQIQLELAGKLDPKVRLSFSPGALYAVKGLKALERILARTYVLFINQKEMQELTGENFTTGAEICLKAGCHIVVVTLGRGTSHKTVTATSYIKDAESEHLVEPASQDIKMVDTTGAGDAFAGGFLYGLLKSKRLKECGYLGDIAAQFCIGEMGARLGLPTLPQLAQRYQELYSEEP